MYGLRQDRRGRRANNHYGEVGLPKVLDLPPVFIQS
jgi:hypothetical protein